MMKLAHVFAGALVALALFWAPEASAQVQSSVVVSPCGSQSLTAGTTSPDTINTAGQKCMTGSSVTPPAISTVFSGSAEACHVLKASSGNLFSAYAVNLTNSAGFLILLNATTVPSDGAVLPVDVAPLPSYGSASIAAAPGNLEVFSTGIVACITSATTPFTKTTGVITGFLHGAVQ